MKDNITRISHGCDRESNKVRLLLHHYIRKWIELQIVPMQFQHNLLRDEQPWTFSRPAPNFPAQQNEGPSTFDMAVLGIIGGGIDVSYLNPTSMYTLVENGMKEGVQDGWLYIDKIGNYKVNIEKALEDYGWLLKNRLCKEFDLFLAILY